MDETEAAETDEFWLLICRTGQAPTFLVFSLIYLNLNFFFVLTFILQLKYRFILTHFGTNLFCVIFLTYWQQKAANTQ